MYDLCVDTGDEVIQMTDEVGFEKRRGPNTKFVMRVVLTQEAQHENTRGASFNTYRCPRCKKQTKVEKRSISASIDWYDVPIVDYDFSRWHLNPLPSTNCGVQFQATDVARGKTAGKDADQDIELWLIRNIHIKQFVRLLWSSGGSTP